MKKGQLLFFLTISLALSVKGLNAQIERVDTAYFDQSGKQVIKTDNYFSYEIRPLDSRKKISGVIGRFTKSGRLIEATKYRRGVKNGAFEKFDREGKVIAYGNYKNNKKIGFWVALDSDERVLLIEEYNKSGELINTRSRPEITIQADSTAYVIAVTEKKPEFKGGMNGWNLFLKRNLRYPTDAKRYGIQGNVLVSFIVLSDGQLIAPRVISSRYRSLTKEAIRVIKKSPKWIPATINGQPIDAISKLTIRFRVR